MSELKKGSILEFDGGMTLRVKDMRGTWVKCDYLSSSGAWKPRGCTENRNQLEAMIRLGEVTVTQ